MTLAAAPRVLVLTGTGINCEAETADAFRRSGAAPEIVHVVDLLDRPGRLLDYQILALPGGFSYGDDTGSGNALAHRLSHHLGDALRRFIDGDRLVLGICNGFQVLCHLGILPGLKEQPLARSALLRPNDPPGFQCRWVELEASPGRCVFLRGMGRLRLPIAHGEGNFYAEPELLDRLERGGQLVLRYAGGAPNGAARDVAGVCDATGRVFGLMPHPERAFDFTQRDDWTREADRLRRRGEPLPERADGAGIFAAAVLHFR